MGVGRSGGIRGGRVGVVAAAAADDLVGLRVAVPVAGGVAEAFAEGDELEALFEADVDHVLDEAVGGGVLDVVGEDDEGGGARVGGLDGGGVAGFGFGAAVEPVFGVEVVVGLLRISWESGGTYRRYAYMHLGKQVRLTTW